MNSFREILSVLLLYYMNICERTVTLIENVFDLPVQIVEELNIWRAVLIETLVFDEKVLEEDFQTVTLAYYSQLFLFKEIRKLRTIKWF